LLGTGPPHNPARERFSGGQRLRFTKEHFHTTGTNPFRVGGRDGLLTGALCLPGRCWGGLKHCYSTRPKCWKLGCRPALRRALSGVSEAPFHQQPLNTTVTKWFTVGSLDTLPAVVFCSLKTARLGALKHCYSAGPNLLETGFLISPAREHLSEAPFHQHPFNTTGTKGFALGGRVALPACAFRSPKAARRGGL
jgi:hypothetical protein